jgi:hypothetical protein
VNNHSGSTKCCRKSDMVLIPPDVGIRMRMQTEANLLQPVQPAHELPSDLPELRPGQQFSARVQEVLPDNTYKALVAGKQITLQLPEGAKTGDQLELVVMDRTPSTLIAKLVTSGVDNPAAPGQPTPYEFAKFSPAARLISQLLPNEGEAPVPAKLNRGEPLLPTPPNAPNSGPNSAAQLATTLAKAVSQSSLFYESHQAQWVTGQRPLIQILQEPQGQHSPPNAFQHAIAEAASRPLPGQDRAIIPNSSLQTASAENEKVGAGGTATTNQATQPLPATKGIPDDLRPLVQQQLEAVSSNRLFWHGEVWPQQTMDWAIELENGRQGDGSNEDETRWNTSLSLTTPRLGRIDAMLQLNTSGVRIILATPYGAIAADLRDESQKLAQALELAGVPLLNLQIKHEDEYHPGKK